MFEIKPNFTYLADSIAQHLSSAQLNKLQLGNPIWSGMNTYANFTDPESGTVILATLPIDHTFSRTYYVVISGQGRVSVFPSAQDWISQLLRQSILTPSDKSITVSKEVFGSYREVIILNCVDFLYGHSLLKLLNAQRHLTQNPHYGLIIIVPKFLRWMVPKGVAEIWTVDITLSEGKKYYPKFNTVISKELERFDKVLLSEAFLQPNDFDISIFTGIEKHDFSAKDFRITFIWREDRLWAPFTISKILKKLFLVSLPVRMQNSKVQRLFKSIKKQIPDAKFTAVGLGRTTKLPDWIDDCRVNSFTDETEKKICKVYAESRLIIGIHGSNMLLPSGHAGMTINLLPTIRLGNFAQDILYQESNPRLATFRYRYLPENSATSDLANTAISMIKRYPGFKKSISMDTVKTIE